MTSGMRSIHALACLRKGMVYFSGASTTLTGCATSSTPQVSTRPASGASFPIALLALRAHGWAPCVTQRIAPTPHRAAREFVMSSRCDVCRRTSQYGHSVSHSNRKTNRRFLVNIQRRRLVIDGTPRNVNVCTRCLRTMLKVEKAR